MSEKVKVKITRNFSVLPAIALRGLVVFPNNIVHFEVGRAKSIAAIEAAMHTNSSIFLVAQKEMDVEEPQMRDLYAYGEATGGILPQINRRIKELGGHKTYKNLTGFTFGTGLGIGQVINGELNLGNNSCVEVFCMRNKLEPGIMAEDGVSIRAVIREYGKYSGTDASSLTPYDIFLIAEGKKEGDAEAAKQSFARFGEIAGDVFATAVLISDSLVVVGGGVTGAMKYIKPALLKEMRSTISTISGDTIKRLPLEVFDLDNEEEFKRFATGESRELKVYGSDDTVIYDPMKRTGIAVTEIGASKAISIGAYTYALAQIDAKTR